MRTFRQKMTSTRPTTAERLASVRQVLEHRSPEEPVLAAVRHAMTSLVCQYDGGRDAALLKARIMRDSRSLRARNLEQQAAWEGVLADFVRSRLPDSQERDLKARVMAANVVASVRATVDYWLATDGRDELSDLVDRVLTALTEPTPL